MPSIDQRSSRYTSSRSSSASETWRICSTSASSAIRSGRPSSAADEGVHQRATPDGDETGRAHRCARRSPGRGGPPPRPRAARCASASDRRARVGRRGTPPPTDGTAGGGLRRVSTTWASSPSSYRAASTAEVRGCSTGSVAGRTGPRAASAARTSATRGRRSAAARAAPRRGSPARPGFGTGNVLRPAAAAHAWASDSSVPTSPPSTSELSTAAGSARPASQSSHATRASVDRPTSSAERREDLVEPTGLEVGQRPPRQLLARLPGPQMLPQPDRVGSGTVLVAHGAEASGDVAGCGATENDDVPRPKPRDVVTDRPMATSCRPCHPYRPCHPWDPCHRRASAERAARACRPRAPRW